MNKNKKIIIYIQFSYASFRANDEWLKQAALYKLNNIIKVNNIFNSTMIIPFASFFNFSHSENQHLTKFVNSSLIVSNFLDHNNINHCFLNPHIDNSHDRKLKKFRRLNLLYYVCKDWNPIKDGGELLLFPDGIKNKEVNISCNFNRLVIMRTDNRSLHAVRKVNSKDNRRKCISNYYFSKTSPLGKNYYHSTSFKGFKNEYLKGFYLKLNGKIRTSTKYLIHKLLNIE